MKRSKGLDKGIILLIVILIVIGVTGYILYQNLKTDRITESIEKGDPIKTAFFVSEGEDLLFTEIFFYHPDTHKGGMLDIPNDIGTIIESMQRIERLDVLFDPEEVGPLLGKIETILDEPVPYYFLFNLEDVERMVDLLEGLEMFIANPVEKLEENPPVLIPSGNLVLDGSKVRQYLTYHEDIETEIENINRKQKFIQTLLKRMGEKIGYLSHPEVESLFSSYIKTNLSKPALHSFLGEMENLDVERIIFQRVLGVKRTVEDQVLLFPHYDGKLLRETVNQTLESLANTEIVGSEELTISIEVLNGTLKSGLAGRTADLLKSFGFEITSVGNADHFNYDNTLVYSRSGTMSKAQKVANVINCHRISTLPQPVEEQEAPDEAVPEGGGIKADVTVILGKDFDGRYCKE